MLSFYSAPLLLDTVLGAFGGPFDKVWRSCLKTDYLRALLLSVLVFSTLELCWAAVAVTAGSLTVRAPAYSALSKLAAANPKLLPSARCAASGPAFMLRVPLGRLWLPSCAGGSGAASGYSLSI